MILGADEPVKQITTPFNKILEKKKKEKKKKEKKRCQLNGKKPR